MNIPKVHLNRNGSVATKDWAKVEKLPFGGPFANHHNGFNDHCDNAGNIYRVTFATWTAKKSVAWAAVSQ